LFVVAPAVKSVEIDANRLRSAADSRCPVNHGLSPACSVMDPARVSASNNVISPETQSLQASRPGH
jgi:hypothetical protein